MKLSFSSIAEFKEFIEFMNNFSITGIKSENKSVTIKESKPILDLIPETKALSKNQATKYQIVESAIKDMNPRSMIYKFEGLSAICKKFKKKYPHSTKSFKDFILNNSDDIIAKEAINCIVNNIKNNTIKEPTYKNKAKFNAVEYTTMPESDRFINRYFINNRDFEELTLSEKQRLIGKVASIRKWHLTANEKTQFNTAYETFLKTYPNIKNSLYEFINRYPKESEKLRRALVLELTDVNKNNQIVFKETCENFAEKIKETDTKLREAGFISSRGKILSDTYKALTKIYGVVYDQLEKEFFNKYGRKPKNTFESLEFSEYASLFTIMYDKLTDEYIRNKTL